MATTAQTPYVVNVQTPFRSSDVSQRKKNDGHVQPVPAHPVGMQ